MINVTYPYLPDKSKYKKYVDEIWDRNWLTNNGPLVKELEQRIQDYLAAKHFLFLSNGTVALQIAIKAFDLKGEIITTPFSYVATTSSIVWEGCMPRFADIDPLTFNIDPDDIEKKITKKTSAIIATHVYGNPCNVEKLDLIAKKHNLKIIYDGAHAFGTKYKKQSVTDFGDITTLSFHATKLFHTIEGGGVVCNSEELKNKMGRLRNFGHSGIETFDGVGINGKNSEFHAAMGLCVLDDINKIIARRKKLSDYYDKKLSGAGVVKPALTKFTEYNYAYYPVVFKDEKTLLEVKKRLELKKINTRRYFYPSLSTLNYVEKSRVPICDDISKRVLCLPLYYELKHKDIDSIAANF